MANPWNALIRTDSVQAQRHSAATHQGDVSCWWCLAPARCRALSPPLPRTAIHTGSWRSYASGRTAPTPCSYTPLPAAIYRTSFTNCWSLNWQQISWMFITVITKVHILKQPNLIQTYISHLCKIPLNRYILLRLCLGLPCGVFHFATLCLWATCATSYLFNLTSSWRMENVKLFNILKVTVQQPVTIFLFSFHFVHQRIFAECYCPPQPSIMLVL